MAVLSFQKPDKVIMIEADEFRGSLNFVRSNLVLA